MNLFKYGWMIAKKDLRVYFRDRMALLLGFLLPVALVTVFGFLMGQTSGGNGPTPKPTLWLADLDESSASETLVAQLRESDMLKIRPREGDSEAMETILTKVDDGESSHLLVIEKGFGEHIDHNEDGGLLLKRDPGREMEDQMIRIGLMQAMYRVRGGDYWSRSMQKSFSDAGMPPEQLAAFAEQADQLSSVIGEWIESTPDDEGTDEVISPMSLMGGDAGIESQDIIPPERPKQVTFQMAQSVAGMAVMMLMFGMASCGTMLVAERDSGTMTRLLSSSIPRGSILVGKTMFAVIVGILQMAVMMVYGELVFRVGAFRDPATLIVLSVVWAITATSFGMLIASIAKTVRQAESMTPIFVLTLAALGGCWFPLQILDLPVAMEVATKSTVTFWAMIGFQGYFWDGLGLSSHRILTALAIQIGFAAAMMTVATLMFRRNYLRG